MRITSRLYKLAGKENQAYIDRLRYALGALPRVRKAQPADSLPGPFPPPPYKACLVVSADLELAWAWRYVRDIDNPIGYARLQAEATRRNFDPLLALFDRYEVPVTWAVVGHLFLERCDRVGARAHSDLTRLPYFENEYWRFQSGDWFDGDPGTNYRSDPDWYGPDLIDAILHSKMKHEIACHSFSHIDFSDGICPARVADGELEKCEDIAREWRVRMNSLVFPANLVGNLEALGRHGITAYRLRTGYELDVPRLDAFGLWQIPGDVQWEKPYGWSAESWIGALKRCVDRALDTGTLFHLWFHPSCERVNVDQVFPHVLEHIAARRDDLWVTTMAGLVDYLSTCADKQSISS